MERHSQMILEPSFIQQVIREISRIENISKDKVGVRKHSGGYLNETYILTYHDTDYFLWINRDPDNRKINRQLNVLDILRRNGHKVPSLVVSKSDRESENYIVTKRLHGENLEQALPSMSTAQKEKYFYKMGQLLSTIHFTQINNRSGYIGDECSYSTWQEFLLQQLGNYVSLLEKQPVFQGVNREELSLLIKFFNSCITKLPSSPVFHLLHGDYYGGNILFSQEGLTGLVDFEWSLWGEREYDFRVMETFQFESTELSLAFYQGYRDHYPIPEGFEERVPFYKSFYYFELLWMTYKYFSGEKKQSDYYLAQLYEMKKILKGRC
ncbi:phosphotransferase [Brevibacillus brevis]|uniref:phosphotransferase n=1 Tax=Brevibacillus brevis TaxID=1393 RepID=UPI00115C15F1|nr:phosphotransferase [Lysinibacillus sp. SDF0063]TQR35774.1 hypothetical protein C7Y45_15715 [Lysinibacillus sp. SDF0063]